MDELLTGRENMHMIGNLFQYLEEAEQLSDYVVILNDGHIAAEGTVHELKRLLPGGSVVLSFGRDEYSKAASLLHDKQAVMNEESRKITVLTDGSVDELTSLLILMKNAGIPVKSATQKEPTLEDVFLTRIGVNTEGYANGTYS